MPMYNYHCEVCEFDFEYMQKMDDRHEANCPSCGEKCKQGLSAPRFIPFPEGVFEHIGPEPLYISDKRQLRGALDEHGAYAPNLLD